MQSQTCFAYRWGGRCQALAVAKCPGPAGCSFFKTTARLEQERHKVWQYILALDEPRRRHIIKVYYSGQMQLLQQKGECP